MKKRKSTVIFIALICIIAGCIMAFSAFAMSGFELGKIKIGDTLTYTVDLETVDWGPERTFAELYVDCTLSNVRFEIASDGIFRLEYSEIEGVEVDVEIDDFTWRITEKDDRGWSQKIGVFDSSLPWMTVYLPEGNHGNVHVKTVSGNIHSLKEEYIFMALDASSVSGDVSVLNPILAEIKVETVSGDISVDGVNNPATLGKRGYVDQLGRVKFNTTSGDVYFADTVVHGGDGFTVDTVSGNVEMSSVTCRGGGNFDNHFIETTSGNITLKNMSFSRMHTESASGNIDVTLTSPTYITAETFSGVVDVSGSSSSANKFKAETFSGNIKISVVS